MNTNKTLPFADQWSRTFITVSSGQIRLSVIALSLLIYDTISICIARTTLVTLPLRRAILKMITGVIALKATFSWDFNVGNTSREGMVRGLPFNYQAGVFLQ